MEVAADCKFLSEKSAFINSALYLELLLWSGLKIKLLLLTMISVNAVSLRTLHQF